jgi:hypothetical protein
MRDIGIASVHERRLLIAITALALSALLILIGSWGYKKYAEARDKKSQLAFVEQLERFEAMRINPEADTIGWEALGHGFARGYVEHSTSSLAPFFLAFQSEVVAHQGLQAEALDLLDRAIAGMRKNTDIRNIYAIKRAVMRLDSENEKISAQGKRELLDLAQDMNNSSQGLAWYHLLEYAIVQRDKELHKLAQNKLQIYPVLAQHMRQMFAQASAEGNE